MANKFTSNPIINDTAVANWTAMSLPTGLNSILVKKIEWYKPTTAGDTFVIKNAAGDIILQGTCETNGVSQVFNFQPAQNFSKNLGWYLQQITSGILYIYY